MQQEGVRRPTAVPSLPGDRLCQRPSHTHRDMHAPILSTPSTAPPAAASARPPRQRPGPLCSRPARGPRGLPTAPERWRRLGPAQLLGSRSTGPRPGSPVPRGAQFLPRSAPPEPAVFPAPHALSRARLLPPSAGPPRVVAGARSPPGVTAWAADSPPAGAHGGARAALAPRLRGRAPARNPERAPLPGSCPRALPSPEVPPRPLRGRPAGPRNPLRAAGLGGALGWACAARSRCRPSPRQAALDTPARPPDSQHILLCLGGGNPRSRAQTAVVLEIGTPPLQPAHRPPAGKTGPRSRSFSSQAEGISPW